MVSFTYLTSPHNLHLQSRHKILINFITQTCLGSFSFLRQNIRTYRGLTLGLKCQYNIPKDTYMYVEM